VDGVAEILGGAVEILLHGRCPGCILAAHHSTVGAVGSPLCERPARSRWAVVAVYRRNVPCGTPRLARRNKFARIS
jgi:hypothetical protein